MKLWKYFCDHCLSHVWGSNLAQKYLDNFAESCWALALKNEVFYFRRPPVNSRVMSEQWNIPISAKLSFSLAQVPELQHEQAKPSSDITSPHHCAYTPLHNSVKHENSCRHIACYLPQSNQWDKRLIKGILLQWQWWQHLYQLILKNI